MANFSNMFVTRDKRSLPRSLELLVNSISFKPVQKLYLHDNALGPIGVEKITDFLRSAHSLKVLSVSNCGLGPEATTMIAESLLANEQTRLTELMISRSRVEEKGAIPLAEYFRTYDTLERLEIFQNAIKNESATLLTKSL